MLSMHSGTAGVIRTKPGMGPPFVLGHVLGYRDPGNSGPRGYPLYSGGEGSLVGRGPLNSRCGGGEGGEAGRVKCTFGLRVVEGVGREKQCNRG